MEKFVSIMLSFCVEGIKKSLDEGVFWRMVLMYGKNQRPSKGG